MGIDSLGPGRFKLDRTCAHHSPRGPATEDPGILLVPGHRASRLVAVFCDRATPIHSTKETDPARHSRRHYFSSGLLLLPSSWSSLLNYLTNLLFARIHTAPPLPPVLPHRKVSTSFLNLGRRRLASVDLEQKVALPLPPARYLSRTDQEWRVPLGANLHLTLTQTRGRPT